MFKTLSLRKPSHKTKDWTDELVLFCVRANFNDEESTRELRQMLTNKIDWHDALELLSWHGLIPIFHHLLASTRCINRVPSWVWQHVHQKCLWWNVCSLAQEAALKDILGCFAQEGIPVMVAKGVYLDQRFYSYKNVRPSADIDLFIREEDADKGIGLLRKIGYRERSGGLRLVLRKSRPVRRFPTLGFLKRTFAPINVGVHRSLGSSKCYRKATKLDINDIWREAHSEEGLDNMSVYQMRIEHLLVYLCLHLSIQHNFSRLIWVRDLKEVIGSCDGSLDWDYFVECVEKWQARTYAYFALFVAKRLCAAGVPSEVLEQIRPRYLSARLFEFLIEKMGVFHPSRWRQDFAFRLITVLGDKPAYRFRAMLVLPFDEVLRLIKRARIWLLVKESLMGFLRKREERQGVAGLSGF